MLNLDLEGEFLVQTRLTPTESVRSFLNRFAAGNKLPVGVFGEVGRLTEATRVASELAPKMGWNLSMILRRGVLHPTREYGQDTVAVGISLLGKRCVVGHRRRICPLCVAQRSWCPLVWELRSNFACHRHGCRLIDTCSRCNAHLSWMTYGADCTDCGLPWAAMNIDAAPPWAVRLATWLWESTNRSLNFVRRDGKQQGWMVYLRLEKLLLMIDVLRHELLRNWLSSEVWERWNVPWTVELLGDFHYRSWLWDCMFLHAARNPMTLSKALIPFGTALSISSHFEGFAPSAPIPYFVIKSLQDLGERKLVKRLAGLRRFDARIDGIHGARNMQERVFPPMADQETDDLWDTHASSGSGQVDDALLAAAASC